MMSTKHNIKAISVDEEGAAAVEFALLLPLLALLIMGMLVFGILLNNYLEITHAAREGVRWAALREPETEVLKKAQSAAPGIDWTKAEVDRDPDVHTQNEPVTVTVTYEIDHIKSMFGPIGALLPDKISSAATQRME